MDLDPDNPVVRLCAEGMQAEAEDRLGDAAALFLRAWDARTDDFEGCVAAHYVARHQDDPRETLRWNELAVTLADAVGDERVRGFYPSLYLNVGAAHERLGDVAEASRWFERAAAHLDAVPAGPYRDVVANGVAAGVDRTGTDAAARSTGTPRTMGTPRR